MCFILLVAMALVRQICSVVVCLVIRCEFYFQHCICSIIVCAVIFHTSPKLPMLELLHCFFLVCHVMFYMPTFGTLESIDATYSL